MGFFISLLLAIVYPNRLLNLLRVKNLDEKSNKILGNDKIVKVLALIAAFVFVVAVRYTPTTSIPSQLEVTLRLDKILDDRYTDFGSPIPSSVDVILTGDSVELELFRLNGGMNDLAASIDLNALEPGHVHDNVLVHVEGVTGQIQWVVAQNPISGIEIARLEEREIPVRVIAALPVVPSDSRYVYGEYRTVPESVTVIGPQRLLDEIDTVSVNFNVSDRILSEEEPMIIEIDEAVPLRGLDRVWGVEIYPSARIEIRMPIYEDLRTVIFELNEDLLNLPTPRSRIDIISITADISEIEIWGDFDNLSDWEDFDEVEGIFSLPRISFRDLDDDGQYTIEIPLPPSIYTEIDGEVVTTIEIVVTVEYEELPEPTEPEPTDSTTPTRGLLEPISTSSKKTHKVA